MLYFGIACAILAALGFSFEVIFIKLAYEAAPVDAVTLLSLRMVFSFSGSDSTPVARRRRCRGATG